MGKTNNKSDLPTTFKGLDQLITDNQKIANSFNDFYTAVGPETNRKVGHSQHDASYYLSKHKPRSAETLTSVQFELEDVMKASQSINRKKSCDAYSFSRKQFYGTRTFWHQ